jgi:hypothetical protein
VEGTSSQIGVINYSYPNMLHTLSRNMFINILAAVKSRQEAKWGMLEGIKAVGWEGMILYSV